MIKIRSIRDRFNPVSFKLGDTFGLGGLWQGLFGLGGDIYTSERQLDGIRETNELNAQLARETNAQEKELFYENLNFQDLQGQISRDFNSVEAQKARDFNAEEAEKNRMFNMVEAQKARDWNAIDAQVERAKSAGINPAYVVTRGDSSSIAATGSAAQAGGAASSSPVSGSALPHLTTPVMQAPTEALGTLAHLGLQMSQIAKNFATSKNINEDTQSKETFNKYADRIYESGIRVNNQTANKLFKDAQHIDEDMIQIRQNVQNLKAMEMLTSSKVTAQDLDNMYKHDFWTASCQALRERANVDEKTAFAIMARLPLELGILKSQEALNRANAFAMDAMGKLNKAEAKKVDRVYEILGTEKKMTDLQWNILKETGMDNAKNIAKQLEFNSNQFVQIMGVLNQTVSSFAQAANAASKYRTPKPSGNTSGQLFDE